VPGGLKTMVEHKKDAKEIPIEFLEEEEKEKSKEKKENDNLDEPITGDTSKKEKKSTEDHKKKKDEYKFKYEELNDHFLRLRSEFANYKRRVEREQLEFADYIKGEYIKKLLPILDDFEHMLAKSNQEVNDKSILDGAKIIFEKLGQAIKELGVEKIDAIGAEFNPQIHEALMMQKVSKKEENGKIISVFQHGYKIKDRLLRPSKVIVGEYEKKDSEEKKLN
jgi:molecular chaperone GrpE